MEEKQSTQKTKRSFMRRWFGFLLICIDFVLDFIRTYAIRYLAFFKRKPYTAIFVPLGLAFVALIIGSAMAYAVLDYTLFHPEFCKTCHSLMIESYTTWEDSSHAGINCHTCHPLTPEYVQSVSISLLKGVVLGFPDKIPERPEGKIIIRSKDCLQCHWEKVEEKEKSHIPEGAQNVAESRFHAVHYFMEQAECVICHGMNALHVFTSDSGNCLECHESHEDTIHMAEAPDVACLNCHTDRTDDLEPESQKCLFCHSDDESMREELLRTGTLDVKYVQPSEETLLAASKIAIGEHDPMRQFQCVECHISHSEEPAPAGGTCLRCHEKITTSGEHIRHLPYYQQDCLRCHRPHSWSIDEEWAQQECAKCHPYQASETFMQGNKQ